MIRLKNRKHIALAVGIGAFMSMTTALFAKKTVSTQPNTDVVTNYPENNVTSVAKVQKVSVDSGSETKLRSFQSGVASYYGPGFHGRRTANGETFNMNAMTAAHRTLPFGTKLKVTNLNNGQSAIVRVNDRGPYASGRVIDLSVAAAKQIGSTKAGTAKVKIEVVEQ